MVVWGIVVAAGSGQRFGGPKQFEVLAGKRVLDWSVETTQAACRSGGVVVVVPPGHREPDLTVRTVEGAATRAGSVRAGLGQVPPDAQIIVVHDAARPLATPALFASVIDAITRGADAAIPAIPLRDTIKRVAGEQVVATVDRTGLVAVQTPQAFRAEALRAAHERDPEATDDAALVEAAGGKVVVVAGDVANLKLTDPEDLVVAAALLAERHG